MSIVLYTISVAARLGAIGIAVYLARAIQQDGNFIFHNIILDVFDAEEFFVISAVLIGTLLLNAITEYFALRLQVSASFDHQMRSLHRVMSGAARAAKIQTLSKSIDGMSIFTASFKSAAAYAAVLSRVFRQIMNMFSPALQIGVSLAVLGYYYPEITVLVIVLLCISLIAQSSISRRSAGHARSFEVSTRESNFLIRNMLTAMFSNEYRYEDEQRKLVESNQSIRENRSAREGRIKETANSKLISAIVLVLAALLICIILFINIDDRKINWDKIVLLIMMLNLVFTGAKTMLANFTTINRFVPHVKRYYDTVDRLEKAGSMNHSGPNVMVLEAVQQYEGVVLTDKNDAILLRQSLINYNEKSEGDGGILYFPASPAYFPGRLMAELLLAGIPHSRMSTLMARISKSTSADLLLSRPTLPEWRALKGGRLADLQLQLLKNLDHKGSVLIEFNAYRKWKQARLLSKEFPVNMKLHVVYPEPLSNRESYHSPVLCIIRNGNLLPIGLEEVSEVLMDNADSLDNGETDDDAL